MKRRLFFIAIILLVAILSVSCSADELSRQSESGTTFELQANEQLSLISIRINDNEGNTLNNYNYQNENNVSLVITQGSEIMVYTVDEDEFEYNYAIKSSNGSIQHQGFIEDAFNYTLVKSYVIE